MIATYKHSYKKLTKQTQPSTKHMQWISHNINSSLCYIICSQLTIKEKQLRWSCCFERARCTYSRACFCSACHQTLCSGITLPSSVRFIYCKIQETDLWASYKHSPSWVFSKHSVLQKDRFLPVKKHMFHVIYKTKTAPYRKHRSSGSLSTPSETAGTSTDRFRNF